MHEYEYLMKYLYPNIWWLVPREQVKAENKDQLPRSRPGRNIRWFCHHDTG